MNIEEFKEIAFNALEKYFDRLIVSVEIDSKSKKMKAYYVIQGVAKGCEEWQIVSVRSKYAKKAIAKLLLEEVEIQTAQTV